MATRSGSGGGGAHLLADRDDEDAALYSLKPWHSYEHVWTAPKKPQVICWAGDPIVHRRVSTPDASLLRRMANLHRLESSAQAVEVVDLAAAFGPLGLCVPHARPVAHLARPALREVQAALDALDPTAEEDGPWWGLRTCQDRPRADRRRTKTIDGKRRIAHTTELLDAWIEWSGILYGLIAVAWRIQLGRPADADHWRLLQPLLAGEADHIFRWTSDTTEDVDLARRPGVKRDDPVGAWLGPLINFEEHTPDTATLTVRDGNVEIRYDLDRPYGEQATATKRAWEVKSRGDLLAAQKRIFSTVLDEFLRLADLRLRFDWDHRPAARLSYGGGTLLGALASQLTLVIGGVNALAICDFCREPFVPSTWPRATGDDNVLCQTHQTDAAKAKLRRRTQRAGTISVGRGDSKEA